MNALIQAIKTTDESWSKFTDAHLINGRGSDGTESKKQVFNILSQEPHDLTAKFCEGGGHPRVTEKEST